MDVHGGLLRWRACALLLLATGCEECDAGRIGSGLPTGHDDGDEVELRPVRDVWRSEYTGDFFPYDADGEPRILSLTIGTPNPFGENFLNRGDVIVEFTGEPDRIEIELRRFTYASSEDAAKDTFEKLQLWAYDTSLGAPNRPEEMDREADCTADGAGWLDGCGIYVYYDGQTQLERAGADIRVTLPPDYRQDLEIVTSDNLAEDTYPNHGNVCIDNLDANAKIDMQSGIARVKLAADASPAPSCDADGIADCTNVDEVGTTANREGLWSPNCICANQQLMGSVTVESDKPYSTDITVDVPASLWTSIHAENEAGDGTVTCPVAIEGVANFVPDPTQTDSAAPWRVLGDANTPSEIAIAGGGFAFKLVSAECEPVAAVERPEDWDENDVDPDADLRGHIEVCAGCLDDPCDDDELF